MGFQGDFAKLESEIHTLWSQIFHGKSTLTCTIRKMRYFQVKGKNYAHLYKSVTPSDFIPVCINYHYMQINENAKIGKVFAL